MINLHYIDCLRPYPSLYKDTYCFLNGLRNVLMLCSKQNTVMFDFKRKVNLFTFTIIILGVAIDFAPEYKIAVIIMADIVRCTYNLRAQIYHVIKYGSLKWLKPKNYGFCTVLTLRELHCCNIQYRAGRITNSSLRDSYYDEIADEIHELLYGEEQ